MYTQIASASINFNISPHELVPLDDRQREENNLAVKENIKGWLDHLLESHLYNIIYVHEIHETDISRLHDGDGVRNSAHIRPIFSGKIVKHYPLFIRYESVHSGSTILEISIYCGIIWASISSYGAFRSGLDHALADLSRIGNALHMRWMKDSGKVVSFKIKIEPVLKLPDIEKFNKNRITKLSAQDISYINKKIELDSTPLLKKDSDWYLSRFSTKFDYTIFLDDGPIGKLRVKK